MTMTRAYANDFELYPANNAAADHLRQLINQLDRVEYTSTIRNPESNNCQITTDFDVQLESSLLNLGATESEIEIPEDVPQQLDFVFQFAGVRIAVEVEKADKEKVLRDILKSHMYLSFGATYSVVALSRNRPFSRGISNLFAFGQQRYDECIQYGFGTNEKFDRICLLGFTEFDNESGSPLDSQWRRAFTARAINEQNVERNK